NTCHDDNTGTMTMYSMRSDWLEPTVTWQTRDGAGGWNAPGAGQPGASGFADHGAVGVTIPYPPNVDHTFVVKGAALDEARMWIRGAAGTMGGKLSFLLDADDSVAPTHAAFASKEYQCGDSMAYRAQLVVSY